MNEHGIEKSCHVTSLLNFNNSFIPPIFFILITILNELIITILHC